MVAISVPSVAEVNVSVPSVTGVSKGTTLLLLYAASFSLLPSPLQKPFDAGLTGHQIDLGTQMEEIRFWRSSISCISANSSSSETEGPR